jgi:hypothetical protein
MKQEPTAWLSKERDVITFDNLFPEMTPLYTRDDVLEEVAREFDSMRIAFGDTSDSFARYVRDMKHERFR